MPTLDDALRVASANDRVCPVPGKWLNLWRMLPGRKKAGAGWEPPLPLVLSAESMPAKFKVARLREHLEWAESHSCLAEVLEFLHDLDESEWTHIGDS